MPQRPKSARILLPTRSQFASSFHLKLVRSSRTESYQNIVADAFSDRDWKPGKFDQTEFFSSVVRELAPSIDRLQALRELTIVKYRNNNCIFTQNHRIQVETENKNLGFIASYDFDM